MRHALATPLHRRVQASTGQTGSCTGRPALSFGVHRLRNQAADSYNVKRFDNVQGRNTGGGARAWETYPGASDIQRGGVQTIGSPTARGVRACAKTPAATGVCCITKKTRQSGGGGVEPVGV